MASPQQTQLKHQKVAIVGSGLIGCSWAMLFAAGGYNVCLYDVDESRTSFGMENIKAQLSLLKDQGALRGSLTVEEQYGLIASTTLLQNCITGAMYVQECVPEDEELKKSVFSSIDGFCSDTTILASSTSSMPASTFTQHITHRDQVIVAHPTNPPFYCPLVEVCPTPLTRRDITEKTFAILKEIGEMPVLIKKELKGFVLNRLQYSLMNECWRLVKDGTISVTDMDSVMRDGLGNRYAFTGPLESAHLNAAGMKDYCARYGENLYKISSGFGPIEKWSGPTSERIIQTMEELIPLDQLSERRHKRDKRLAALAVLKKKMAVEVNI